MFFDFMRRLVGRCPKFCPTCGSPVCMIGQELKFKPVEVKVYNHDSSPHSDLLNFLFKNNIIEFEPNKRLYRINVGDRMLLVDLKEIMIIT